MIAAAKPAAAKVVIALDGSPAAATALPLARRVAEQLGGTVEALRVAEGEPSGAAAPHAANGELAAIPVRRQCGDAAVAIVAAAADPEVALVVLTTHGREIEPGRGLGRVAQAAIAAATQPLLLLRPEAAGRAQAAPLGLRRLLVPLDGTPTTAKALRPVTELAARLGATVDLLYVADPDQPLPGEQGSIAVPRYVNQPQHEWPQWASEVIARLARACAGCPETVPVRMYLAAGEVATEVLRFATTHDEDAIVLVRRSGLSSGHGRVLRTLLEQTPCSILLVGGPSS